MLVLALTLGKAIIITALTRLFDNNASVALRTGLVVAQGGEFGFALLSLAFLNRLMTPDESQATLAAIVISMALSPLVLRYNESIAKSLLRDIHLHHTHQEASEVSAGVKELENHVILCGYRRMGQNLARFLQEQGVSYVALDLDPRIVESTWKAGEPVYYADASRPEILLAAGLQRARMVVITVAEVEVAKRITETIRHKNSDIPILVRTRGDSHIDELERLGATIVLPEILEATIMITHRMLEQLGVSPNEVFQVIEKIRGDSYRSLRSYFHGENDKISQNRLESFLHTFTVHADDDAMGRSIAELELERFGISVRALRRGDIRGDHPSPEMRLRAGDILVLESDTDKFQNVINVLKNGGKSTKSAPNVG